MNTRTQYKKNIREAFLYFFWHVKDFNYSHEVTETHSVIRIDRRLNDHSRTESRVHRLLYSGQYDGGVTKISHAFILVHRDVLIKTCMNQN